MQPGFHVILALERVPLVRKYYRDGGGNPYKQYKNTNLYAGDEESGHESFSESDAEGDRDIQEIY